MNCPKCDQEMHYEPCDPSVGIMRGGYSCDECDVFIGDDEIDSESDFMDDAILSRTDGGKDAG